MISLATGAVTQYGVLDALLAGAYGEGIAAADVEAFGDHGLGCSEGLGAEVALVDGVLVECAAGAAPRPMSAAETLPFVTACTFPDVPAEPVAGGDLASLGREVERRLRSRNLFHAIRLDGTLASVRLRVPPRPTGTARPLEEVTRAQVETVLEHVTGTLVGFWTPEIYQGIAVAGLHIHFLSAGGDAGGHVLDLTVASAELRMAAYAAFTLRLPTDPLFLRTPLTHDHDHRIVALET